MENNWNNMINNSMGRRNTMNDRINNFYNSYNAPHYEVIQVNGRAGAENFHMGPNSSALLLDNTAPIIWLVKTDGSGLSMAIPYDYSPHQDVAPISLDEIQQRLLALEEKVNNVQPNSRPNKQQKRNNGSTNDSANESN